MKNWTSPNYLSNKYSVVRAPFLFFAHTGTPSVFFRVHVIIKIRDNIVRCKLIMNKPWLFVAKRTFSQVTVSIQGLLRKVSVLWTPRNPLWTKKGSSFDAVFQRSVLVTSAGGNWPNEKIRRQVINLWIKISIPELCTNNSIDKGLLCDDTFEEKNVLQPKHEFPTSNVLL